MSAQPTVDCRVGISLGGGAQELARYGFSLGGMNRFSVRLARVLLAERARLAYGHDWRPGGVMEAISGIALDYLGSEGRLEDGAEARILNSVPWPSERSNTDEALLERLSGLVAVRTAGLSSDLNEEAAQALEAGKNSDAYKLLQARGLTHLRRKLVQVTQARFAAGGKLEGYSGRMPGIVEEVLLSLEAKQPVYLAGLLGGAARVLGQVVLEEGDPKPLWKHLQLEDLYRERWPSKDKPKDPLADACLDREALTVHLRSSKLRKSLLDNGLSEDENLRLLHSTLEEEVIALVLRGLKRRC